MKLIAKDFKKIKRISPSQYNTIKNCAYKLVLAEAYEKKPQLPHSPYAYMGTVIHRVLEKIIKGYVKNETDFNLIFIEEVTNMEKYLKDNGLEYYTPLKQNVKDFGMKKILLQRRVNHQAKHINNSFRYISEKWYETRDGILGGKIDLIIDNSNDIEIIDFKTGNIKSDVLDDNHESNDIKEEYKVQLKLYAFLYYDTERRFPTKLNIVNMQNEKFSVEFNIEECLMLYNEVKDDLNQINSCIETNKLSELAILSESNCKRCLYRPACSFYNEYLSRNVGKTDLSGIITNIKKFLNGSVSIEILINDQIYVIRGFNESNFNYLNNLKNNRIYVYNIFEKEEFTYQVNKTTMIYE